MYRIFNHRTNMGVGHQFFIAPNPPYGASISYFVKAKPAGAVPARVTVLDTAGRVVREFEGPAEAGVNRVSWDLRYGSPLKPPAGLRPDPPGQPGGPRMRVLTMSQGPLVLPGEYVVRVSVGALTKTTTVRVKEDPRIRVDETELRDHRTAWHRLFWLYVDSNVLAQRTGQAGRPSRRGWNPCGRRAGRCGPGDGGYGAAESGRGDPGQGGDHPQLQRGGDGLRRSRHWARRRPDEPGGTDPADRWQPHGETDAAAPGDDRRDDGGVRGAAGVDQRRHRARCRGAERQGAHGEAARDRATPVVPPLTVPAALPF